MFAAQRRYRPPDATRVGIETLKVLTKEVQDPSVQCINRAISRVIAQDCHTGNQPR